MLVLAELQVRQNLLCQLSQEATMQNVVLQHTFDDMGSWIEAQQGDMH